MSLADKAATANGNNATILENVDKVYESGRQAEYDALWDALQCKGTKTNYTYHFYTTAWTNSVFKPKYPFPKAGTFACAFQGTGITNLSEYTFYVQIATSMFASSKIQEVGDIIIVSNTAALSNMFSNCISLKTIGHLTLYNDQTTNSISYSNTFTGCPKLENIVIEGMICKPINFAQSPLLTHDSLMSIINALSTTGNGQKLTIGSTNIAKLTEDELAQITAKGWTYA